MADKYPIKSLVIDTAYKKVYTSGNIGFFGKAHDPVTGQRFQIVSAVEIADTAPKADEPAKG